MKKLKWVIGFLTEPTRFSILNLSLVVLIVGLNFYFQAFCIPSNWAIVLLLCCFTSTSFYPLLETNTKVAPYASFVNGISFFIFLYCIIFLGAMNLWGLLLIFFGLGLILFVPHFFLMQILWKNIINPQQRHVRLGFLTGFFFCAIGVMCIGKAYQQAILSMHQFEQSGYKTLERSFLNEKILGMHFIYHTRIEMIYDGWRPPKHEPILVIGMWLNNRIDPLKLDLSTRLRLYKQHFPERRYKFNCSCAWQYSQSYHQDLLWKQ